MRLNAVPFLLASSLRGRRTRTLAVILGLAVGMFALGLSVVAGLGLGFSLQVHLRSLFPAQRIVLHPKSIEALWLKFNASSITPATVAKVRALPGVARVSPEATVRFPISAAGELLGNAMQTAISVSGVEPWLMGDEVSTATMQWDPTSTKPVPAVLSYYFLDLYNMGLAEGNGLPKFSASAIVGKHITLLLGESTITENKGSKTLNLRSQIVGLTRDPDLLGLILPLNAVEAMNAWDGIADKQYRALHVELTSPQAVEAIQKELPKLGLEMRDRMAPWRRALAFVWLIGIGFVMLGLLVFILAIAYMASAVTWMLAERRRDLAIFRALGATSRQVAALVATEIALTCLIGIGLGLSIAVGLTLTGNHYYHVWRADRAFLPDNLFAVPWRYIIFLGIGCWLAAMLLCLGRVIIGTRTPIAGVLGKGE